MFLCIPIIFGCQTKIKPTKDGEKVPKRICPNCRNVNVVAAKSTTWFELFWVPLVPISRKHLWICQICQWREPLTNNNLGPPQAQDPATGAWVSPAHSGYQPGYIHP